MFTPSSIRPSTHRRLIALLLFVIACGALPLYRSEAAQQNDRAPELQKRIAELIDVLQVRPHGNVAQHRTQYNQVRQAIGNWNASARSDADFGLMAGWLRAALRTAEQGGGQLLPPVPTLSAQVAQTPLETPAGRVPETKNVAINLSEFHSRIRGTNRELQKVENELSLSKGFSALRLAELAKLLGNLVRQRDFLTLYFQSLSTSEQTNTPRLLPVDTAIRLLTERITQLRHTLRRRGSGSGNGDQMSDRLLLTEASRLLNKLRGH